MADFAYNTGAFVAPQPSLRAKIERAVDKLLSMLDDLDGDNDMEPSFGSIAADQWTSQTQWADGGDEDEREMACEGEADDDEREPDLGWHTVGNQGLRVKNEPGDVELIMGYGSFDHDRA